MTFPILPSNSAVGGYQVQRSLRFNSADSAYLNRTPSVAGNRKTWTWSGWIKRGLVDQAYRSIFGTASAEDYIQITDDYKLTLSSFNSIAYCITTTQVLRDSAAWYHFVVAVDTTEITSTNRVKFYLNGIQITSFSTANYPTQNYDTSFNNTVAHYVGWNNYNYYDGYLTEVNFIDGQALTPSSFGQTNATTGQWQPKSYSGSYGTNGFYLNFSDNSGTTATTLGKDYSGNGNNWTPNNFSVTPGAGNDSMIDVPTNWGTDTSVGGSVRGNYSTINPLDVGSGVVASNGNLDVSNAGGDKVAKTTIGFSSGKWYAEVTCSTYGSNYPIVGIAATDFNVNTLVYIGQTATSYGYGGIGTKLNNGSAVGYAASWTAGDIIGIAVDLDAGTITFYKNGTSQGVAFTGIPAGTYCFAYSLLNGTVFNCNFGQRPFAYTPPSGFKALNTQNIAAGTITTSGTFTGNVNADGPFVWLNGVPTAMTINGNAVTFGTHADKLSNGFKVRTSSTSYNNTGSNTYSITTTGARFKVANAQGNP